MTSIFGALDNSPYEALLAIAPGDGMVWANQGAQAIFAIPESIPAPRLMEILAVDPALRLRIDQALEQPELFKDGIETTHGNRHIRLLFHRQDQTLIIHARDVSELHKLSKQVAEYSSALVSNYFDLEISRRAIGTAEQEKTNMVQAAIEVVAMTMEMKDRYTYGHSRRVAALSRHIAGIGGLSEQDQETIHRAALLHDIGKLGVISDILRKPGELTPDEHAIIHRHPKYGHDLLINLPHFSEIANIVLHHHENWDGTGYPDGLTGDDIPLASSIISCADAFDAICTNRPYRPQHDFEFARTEITQNSGSQFRPDVAAWFLTMGIDELTAIENMWQQA